MLADANTSARAPPAISPLSKPDAPNFACTSWRDAATNAPATSVSAERRLPAAKRCTASAALARAHIVAATSARAMRITSRSGNGGVGEEQLLAVDLVVGDRLLALGRDEPVDEGLAQLVLHVRMLCRIHQDDAVLVEQLVVAFDRDGEVAAVLEREPGAAIGERVGV